MVSPPRILVIEDEPLVRFSLTAFLEDSGFACTEAADGAAGLEAFGRVHPDLVLTDLRMPRLDGFGVLAALRIRSPETPIVVLTGSGDASAAEDVVAQGARACLFKPLYNMETLVETLRSLLGPHPAGERP